MAVTRIPALPVAPAAETLPHLPPARVAELAAVVIERFVRQGPNGPFKVTDRFFESPRPEDPIERAADGLRRALLQRAGPYARMTTSRLQRIEVDGAPLAVRYVGRTVERSRAEMTCDVLFLPHGQQVEGWRPLSFTTPHALAAKPLSVGGAPLEDTFMGALVAQWSERLQTHPVQVASAFHAIQARAEAGLELTVSDRKRLAALVPKLRREVERELAEPTNARAVSDAKRLYQAHHLLGDEPSGDDRALARRAYVHDIAVTYRRAVLALALDIEAGNRAHLMDAWDEIGSARSQLVLLTDLPADAREFHRLVLPMETLRLAGAAGELTSRLDEAADRCHLRISTMDGHATKGFRLGAVRDVFGEVVYTDHLLLQRVAAAAASMNPFRAAEGRTALAELDSLLARFANSPGERLEAGLGDANLRALPAHRERLAQLSEEHASLSASPQASTPLEAIAEKQLAALPPIPRKRATD